MCRIWLLQSSLLLWRGFWGGLKLQLPGCKLDVAFHWLESLNQDDISQNRGQTTASHITVERAREYDNSRLQASASHQLKDSVSCKIWRTVIIPMMGDEGHDDGVGFHAATQAFCTCLQNVDSIEPVLPLPRQHHRIQNREHECDIIRTLESKMASSRPTMPRWEAASLKGNVMTTRES